MKRRRLLVAIAFTIIALVAFAAGAAVVIASKPAARRRITVSPARTVALACRSRSLGGTLPALVYLPAGYGSSSRPYPVIYFLHGLPANPTSYEYNGFVADALVTGGLRAIVVAPQGARSVNSDREYLDWGPTENWPAAIAHDLTHCIDARYQTIASRFGRVLVGLSAGGYGAFNVGLRNLQTFGAVQSWSGYFAATDPSGLHVLNLGSVRAESAAAVPSGTALGGAMTTWPAFIAFYVGRQDSRFLDMNRHFDARLTGSRIAHLFRTYDGGHSEALWRAQAPHWLGLALSYLSRAARRRSEHGGVGL